jgi:tetratricopeptide (TPR) repeat protein
MNCKSLVVFPLLLVALTSTAPLAAAEPTPAVDPFLAAQLQYRKWEPVLAKARRDAARKEWPRAASRLEPVLSALPDHHEANFLMACVANADRDYPAALARLERAEASLAVLAGQCAAWREKDSARLALEAKNQQELLSGEATRGKVHSTCSKGDTTMMVGYMEQNEGVSMVSAPVASLTPESFRIPAAYSFLHGNCLFQGRRFADAAAQYEKAIATEPGHTAAYNNLVNLRLVDNPPAEALAALQRAEAAHVKINPELKKAVLAATQVGVQ